MTNEISFPKLGLNFEVCEVAFEAFGRSIYWYAIIIATGFLLAVLYGMKRRKEFDLTEDNIIGMLMLAVPLAIICARLYYVIFNFEPYRHDLKRIFYIWEGGIAIYGAIIGAIIAAAIYCRFKKISIIRFFDIGALGLMIGQSIGRWGNFVNCEAYGGQTTLPWGMSINGFDPVHPTFLYESLWNAVGFIVLHFYSKKRKFNGEIFWLYVAWYGIGRAIIEGLRTDSLYFFNTGIRTSQALAIASAVLSVAYLVYRYFKIRKEKMEEKENECCDN